MKKMNVLAFAAALAMGMSLTSCNNVSSKANLKSDVDSASYAIGVSSGEGFKENLKTLPGGEANIDALIIGFTQALKGEKTTMTKEVAQKYLNDYFQSATKKEAAITKAEGAKFMAENKSKDGVITTESGIEYKVEKEGNGPKPKATDKVKVHYVGTLLDGTEFDSSVKRGQPATFNLSQVIPGWTEGIQLMPVGSKYTFWIPSELAYGDHGTQGIKPGSTLKFEVELLSIEK